MLTGREAEPGADPVTPEGGRAHRLLCAGRIYPALPKFVHSIRNYAGLTGLFSLCFFNICPPSGLKDLIDKRKSKSNLLALRI